MVKDDKKDASAKAVTPASESTTAPITESKEAETVEETTSSEEPKTLPKIRLRVGEETDKVKKFATAQGLSMHLKVVKAKRAGLTALHKMATWLTPKK